MTAALRRILAESKPPTAVFSSNARCTVSVVSALQALGRNDVAVVGFGDFPTAAALRPAITVINQDGDEMGRFAVERLFARLDDPDRQLRRRTVLPVSLVTRTSCALPGETVHTGHCPSRTFPSVTDVKLRHRVFVNFATLAESQEARRWLAMRATRFSGRRRTSSTTSGTTRYPHSCNRAVFIRSCLSASGVACHCMLSYSATSLAVGQAKSVRQRSPHRSTISSASPVWATHRR